MSECVVRMEMPEKCFNCDLRYECNAFYAPGKPKPFMKGCRIICALPESHGPLVDIDRKFLRVATVGHGISLNWNGSIADMIDADNMRGVEIIVPATETEATPCP